jgi:hypothetical protein
MYMFRVMIKKTVCYFDGGIYYDAKCVFIGTNVLNQIQKPYFHGEHYFEKFKYASNLSSTLGFVKKISLNKKKRIIQLTVFQIFNSEVRLSSSFCCGDSSFMLSSFENSSCIAYFHRATMKY